MINDALVVNVSAAVVMCAGVIRNWYTAKGQLRPVYWLMLVMSMANAVTNITVSYYTPKYIGLWAYNVLIIWSVIMAIKGLVRLSEEEKSKNVSNKKETL